MVAGERAGNPGGVRGCEAAGVRRGRAWLAGSLVAAAIFGGVTLARLLPLPYAVQDDARLHVVWLERLVEPGLFPGDLIADYWLAVGTPGPAVLYRALAAAGVHPLTAAKFLPIALGIIGSLFCHLCVLEIVPVPAAAFLATVFYNLGSWGVDDLVSAGPRAFAAPLLLAFLYFLLRGDIAGTLAGICLLAWCYPQAALVAAVILAIRAAGVLGGARGRPEAGRDLLLWVAGSACVAAILWPYLVSAEWFGPLVSEATARTMPEFREVHGVRGRVVFFEDKPLTGLIFNSSSGIAPGVLPPLVWFGLALPWLLSRPGRYPLARAASARIVILAQTLLAAALLFFVAHLVLFRLFFPNRFVYEPLRLVLFMAAGVAWVVWGAEAIPRWWRARARIAGWFPLAALACCAAASAWPVLLSAAPPRLQAFVVGSHPRLYAYLGSRSPSTLVATIAPEGDNLPAFALRPVFVGREFAVPYHLGYYRRFRERVESLLEAQYTPDAAVLSAFLARSRVDYWLLEADAFAPGYLTRQGWLLAYAPLPARLEERRGFGELSVLERLAPDCETLREGQLRLVSAACLGERLNAGSPGQQRARSVEQQSRASGQ